MAANTRLLAILLQETHSNNNETMNKIKNKMRKYIWFRDEFPGENRGLVIGVRKMDQVGQVIPQYYDKSKGGLFGVEFDLGKKRVMALNIYRHKEMKWTHLEDLLSSTLKPTNWNIVGGDLNWDLKDKEVSDLEDLCSKMKMNRLQWNEFTHYKGRCIDHLFLPSSLPEKKIFVNAVPSDSQDHAMLVGGTTSKEWELNSKRKRIPDYLVNDPDFIKTLMSKVGKYVEHTDPVEYITHFKKEAWALTEIWRDLRKEFQIYKDIWKIRTLRTKLLKMRLMRKPSRANPFTELEETLMRDAGSTEGELKDKKWRKTIVRKMILAANKRIDVYEQQLGIAHPQKSFKTKNHNSTSIKGVLIDGVITRNGKEMREGIKKFWGDLLGQTRPFDLEALDELMDQHETSFEGVSIGGPDEKSVMKLLSRSNNTSAGPDGIPFSLYRATRGYCLKMWVELIEKAAEDEEFPLEFGESQLVLIPKVDNIPRPDQFRPISVTNSDYRIIMRWWALHVTLAARPVISKYQNAMLEGRSIDVAVETIHDAFMEALASGEDVAILQTDFKKAYDFVNRDALIHILQRMKAPPHFINVVKKVVAISKTWLPNIGNEKEFSYIDSQTGVRQGCPISPLLFIIVFDILLASLKRNHSLKELSGYMDDLALMVNKVQKINDLTATFEKYEKATGAQLNYDKCFVLSTKKYTPEGPWATMAKRNYQSNETTYLGVIISTRMNPTSDWFKTLNKMKAAGRVIKNTGGSYQLRVSRINIFMISCTGYLARFKLISRKVAIAMWKVIRMALGSYANTKTRILTSRRPQLNTRPRIIHPILFNWALLNSRKPMRKDYKNPLSIGAMRQEALRSIHNISPIISEGNRTKNSYSHLAFSIPLKIKDFFLDGGEPKYLIYNLAHSVRPPLKRMLLKFTLRGLPTRDKLSHFTSEGPMCRLCKEEKESRHHILNECQRGSEILGALEKHGEKLKIPTWSETEGMCGLSTVFLTKNQTSIVGAALMSLWLTVNAEGTQSDKYAVQLFEEILYKHKLIPKQPKPIPSTLTTNPIISNPTSQASPGDEWMMYYDGSGRVDPHIGGAGYVILHHGREVAGGFETIPLGSNNVGEFRGCLLGLKRAKSMCDNITVVGDCEILTKAVELGKDVDATIDNVELDLLLREIRELFWKFNHREITHVKRHLNKRADAIASAASWSREDGDLAVGDEKWDPRARHSRIESEEWIIENSKLWSWLNEPLNLKWSFPTLQKPTTYHYKRLIVITDNYYFPCQGKPDNSRINKVILNQAMEEYFMEKVSQLNTSITPMKTKRRRRRSVRMPKQLRSATNEEIDKYVMSEEE